MSPTSLLSFLCSILLVDPHRTDGDMKASILWSPIPVGLGSSATETRQE